MYKLIDCGLDRRKKTSNNFFQMYSIPPDFLSFLVVEAKSSVANVGQSSNGICRKVLSHRSFLAVSSIGELEWFDGSCDDN